MTYDEFHRTNYNARVDLRSDTVTQPSEGMKSAMISAPLGDDVYGDDPSVNFLQEKVAKLFDKEAALLVSSGTQSNLCAMLAHCERGDEVLTSRRCFCIRWSNVRTIDNSNEWWFVC
jgi:threonine aldolase